jgi:serine/threonine protein kinase
MVSARAQSENVLLKVEGDKWTCKVADFGTAKIIRELERAGPEGTARALERRQSRKDLHSPLIGSSGSPYAESEEVPLLHQASIEESTMRGTPAFMAPEVGHLRCWQRSGFAHKSVRFGVESQ